MTRHRFTFRQPANPNIGELANHVVASLEAMCFPHPDWGNSKGPAFIVEVGSTENRKRWLELCGSLERSQLHQVVDRLNNTFDRFAYLIDHPEATIHFDETQTDFRLNVDDEVLFKIERVVRRLPPRD